MSGIFIIAEAGVNHNGSYDMAFQLVDAAVESGADAVKFQTFKAESVVTKNLKKANYQQANTSSNESQLDMVKKLELPYEWHLELAKYCSEKGILFMSTAFDHASLGFLVNNLHLKTLKIPSGELTNAPLLLAYAQTGCDLIVSTGVATLGEIEIALGVISYGLLIAAELRSHKKYPTGSEFQRAYNSEAGIRLLRDKVRLLHCTTEYPAPFDEVNLNAMLTMQSAFNLQVGYSDHTCGITVPVVAASLGAIVIEKHFTLNNHLPGPDHMSSLEPDELKRMVSEIRVVEKVLGNGIKHPTQSEIKNRDIIRRSIVASKEIQIGEKYTIDNITTKRPGTGLNPMLYWKLLGNQSNKNYQQDDFIFE